MREAFIEKNFSAGSLLTIGKINSILSEYERQGYDLSLRQLYYQLVARGEIENSMQSYKRIGNLVSDARLAGLIDWNMIADRGRVQVANSHWSSPKSILESAAYSFAIDKWADQPYRILVMVEKQALEGVLIPVCRSLDIPFIANKGYSSSSSLYEIGKALEQHIEQRKRVMVLYLGDHDPSGIDMTRDVLERLRLFARIEDPYYLDVERLALNYDQVEVLNPPPNPAKESDSRFEGYVERYGETCWELDAIEPRQLAGIVRAAVGALRDYDLWRLAEMKEQRLKDELYAMAAKYADEPTEVDPQEDDEDDDDQAEGDE